MIDDAFDLRLVQTIYDRVLALHDMGLHGIWPHERFILSHVKNGCALRFT